MHSERVRKSTSRSGLLNVEVEGLPYHSVYDPQREAEKFYRSYPIEKADFVLHFGWGLGYCGEILRNRIKPSARVLVFEPDEELFAFALANFNNRFVLDDPRFQFVVGERVCQFFDDWILEGCQEADEFMWLVWPGAQQAHPELLKSVQEKFKVRLRDRAANLLTHFQNGVVYFQNAMNNFRYQTDPDAGLLFDRFKNVPLVIVSAGPSLDRNVRELRGFEDRCFIMAVDTALRPLLAGGITPHAVVIADPTELNAQHIVGAVPDSVYLIAEQAVDPSAMPAANRRFLYGVGLFPDPLCAEFGFEKSPLQVWGSVSTAALDLAYKMGANPIIFIGQDFSYAWNRDYARHTIFEDKPFDLFQHGTHHVIDIWNRPVMTTENLIAYHDFFVRRIRQIAGRRFINATEGGILKDAVEVRSLRDALSCCGERIDIAGRLRRAHTPAIGEQSRVQAALRHLCHVLKNRDPECNCLNAFLDLTAKEALLKQDDHAIDERILWGWRICEELRRTHAES